MKHLKPFNEDTSHILFGEQVREIFKEYVNWDLIRDLEHAITQIEDMGKNVDYMILSTNTEIARYETSKNKLKFQIADMNLIKAYPGWNNLSYSFHVEYYNHRPDDDPIYEISNNILDKLSSKYNMNKHPSTATPGGNLCPRQ